ncbi:hypothetical protein NPIL_121041 [Nephila pilipes]|uniref:Uncharacterized protein n=1 Tax=Nephila pilipes TaxID=299642 RepID=A0A8X6MZF2_NEPPI|nr:hypothetical protein NPIL_121041 [Nephila pilipes]
MDGRIHKKVREFGTQKFGQRENFVDGHNRARTLERTKIFIFNLRQEHTESSSSKNQRLRVRRRNNKQKREFGTQTTRRSDKEDGPGEKGSTGNGTSQKSGFKSVEEERFSAKLLREGERRSS